MRAESAWLRVLIVPTVAAALVGAIRSDASAQALMTIEGHVRSEDGSVVAGARVTAVERETGVRRVAVTARSGWFVILGLEPGNYLVTAARLGYAPAARTVQLVVGRSERLTLTLTGEPLPLDQVHVIAPAGPGGELQRTSIGRPVLEADIRDLPFGSRNVMELASVVPGVRFYRTLPEPRRLGITSIPSAGPFGTGAFINMYVDGLSLKNLYNAGITGFPATGSPLPSGALKEFRVVLNPYDAEYTHAGAYVISAVTHRGTSETRGSAFGFFQNGDMVATTPLQRTSPGFSRPDYGRRIGGFTLRGPLSSERLFYAASYEASLTSNFIQVNPGRPSAEPGFWDEYAGTFRAPNRNHVGLFRLTYTPGSRHTFDGSWSARALTGTTLFGDTIAYQSAVEQDYSVYLVNLRHRWMPTSRFSNELSVQTTAWTNDERALFDGPELRYPGISIGNHTSHRRIREAHSRLINRASLAVENFGGSHVLKGGIEIGHGRSVGHFPQVGRGQFLFLSHAATAPVRARIAVGLHDPETDHDALASVSGALIGLHVADEWRPRSNLTLNVGVRYDVEPGSLNNRLVVPWAEDPVLGSIPELAGYLNRGDRRDDRNNLAPRISFSWDPLGTERTFVRGGFGIMYDRVPRFAAFQEHQSIAWRVYTFANPQTTDPEVLRQRVLAGDAAAVPAITLLPVHPRTPKTRQWSLGIGRRLAPALTVNVDLLQQEARRLYAPVNLNWLDGSGAPPRRVLSPLFGDIVVWDGFARARYSALLTQLSYEAVSFGFSAAHTLAYARAQWDAEGDVVPAPSGVKDMFFAMQRTTGDERHRFVASGIGTLPWATTVSTIITVASPRPYTVTDGRDLNSNAFTGDDWIGGRRYGAPANRWRNWYRTVDVRASHPLAFGGRARVWLIGEAFNLFNSENYAGFFGQQRDGSGQELATFGLPSRVFAARQLQVGARTEF